MAGFPALTRRKSEAAPRQDLPEQVRLALPAGFEAAGEALASGVEPAAACAEIGRALARDGASLGEALSGLDAVYQRVLGVPPSFAAVESLAVSWSEATLEFLHQLSCEDPLTGLASLAHVRTRIDEIYREAQADDVDIRTAHALVVVSAVTPGDDPFRRALVLAQVAAALHLVFASGETVGQLGASAAVAVVRRRPDLGSAVSVLREYLEDLRLPASEVRVWIEGLPAGATAATRLLDELAR